MKFQFLLLGALNSGASLASVVPTLPQVDLGYEVHEALWQNGTSNTYTFSNIRYAQQPVRFSAPVAPTERNPKLQKGNEIRICPQAYATWGLASHALGVAYLSGNVSSYNYTLEREKVQVSKSEQLSIEVKDPSSEDCLFLDVTVPKSVFDRRNSTQSKGAPVLVWLHGGGYVFGHKADPFDGGDPSGIIEQSMHDGSAGIIFVAPNYRLGAFGWLAGESLDAINGTANVGLHDQRLALKWVQNNIHLFGGDPTQVTLAGLSAGGGSVVHQITAYGGSKGPAPFQRAFINSPGYQPINSNFQVENRTQTLLRLANVTSLAEARDLPFEVLRRANAEHVLTADFGFWYGPAVDGDLVPALPGISLNRGKFNKGLNGEQMDLLISYAVNEGGEYNAPWISTDEQFKELLYSNLMPNINKELADFVTKTLYPGDTPVRTIKFGGEYGFTCNANYLARAFSNKTYTYMYDIYPGFHGYDVPYTFHGSSQPALEPALYPEQAVILQRYLTNFVKNGNPNGKDLPTFPQQGHNESMNVMRKDGWVTERDGSSSFNCRWMQKGLFF